MSDPRVVLAPNRGHFTLDGTRTYIVGARSVAILDPGPADGKHLRRVAEAVRDAESGVILLTHGHPDHAAGAPELARLTGFPMAGDLGWVERRIGDGDRIEVDEGWLEAIPTPGHARGHLAFHHRSGREGGGELYVGDLLLGEGKTSWVGEYPGCVRDYLDSLDRVEALGPARIFPAHGPVLEHPIEAVSRFRKHRLERIEQARALFLRFREEGRVPWEGGSEAPGEEAIRELADSMLDRIYGEALAQGAREGARWSLRALLEYLGVAPFPPEGAPSERRARLAPGS